MNSISTPPNTPEKKTVTVTSDSIDSSTRYDDNDPIELPSRYAPIELLSSPETKMIDYKNGGPPPTPKRPKKKQD